MVKAVGLRVAAPNLQSRDFLNSQATHTLHFPAKPRK
jgi:hypothetical protein